MQKIGRWIIGLMTAAFLLGLLPFAVGVCREFFALAGDGVGIFDSLAIVFSNLISALKGYTWHFVIAYAIVAGLLIFMEGRNPDRTILWLLVLIFIPVFGVVLYIILGPNFKQYRNKKYFLQNQIVADRATTIR